MTIKRPGAVTFRGNPQAWNGGRPRSHGWRRGRPNRSGRRGQDGRGSPLTALGPELQPGDPAPDFNLLARDMSAVDLAATGDRVRLFSVVPSLDTSVCAEQTIRFNQALAELPGSIGVYAVSVDLPFAQARFCGDAGLERVVPLSDLLSRAVFVLDPEGRIHYREYVTEIGSQPDHAAALAAVRELAL